LPFPALDGGRILFLLVEKIKGRPVSPKLEKIIHAAGLYILLFLMLLITFKDISRFGDKFAMLWEKITK
jgi:regulator of sigma E protease